VRKNILLAGVLSLVAIFGTVAVYNTWFLPEGAERAEGNGAVTATEGAGPADSSHFEGAAAMDLSLPAAGAGEEVIWENRLFRAVFSTRGAVLTSFTLKEYGHTELVLTIPESSEGPLFFKWGGMDAPVVDKIFRVTRDSRSLHFTAALEAPGGRRFLLEKTVSFLPDEYMMKVDLRLSGDQSLPVTPSGILYTLGLGPQTGPSFGELDGKYDYRHFMVNRGGEKRTFRVPGSGMQVSDDGALFGGVEGRYFVSLMLFTPGQHRLAWDARPLGGLEARRSLGMQRLSAGEPRSEVSDTFHVFLGPKDRRVLASYDEADNNGWALSGTGLGAVPGQSALVVTLSEALLWILSGFSRFTGGYGLAVILLALLVEAGLFVFKRKTLETNGKMRLYLEEVGEIKRRWAGDKQKALTRIREFYAARGIVPRPATRTLLVHLPVFILLYILFLTHPGLRDVSFLPGVIPDLARPDVLFSFAPRRMPLTGWSEIRLLPLLVLTVTLVQSRFVQPPPEAFGTLRTMSILLPVMIFMVLYNMPAGAVLYWLTQTGAAVGLQLFYNRKVARQEGGEGGA